MWYAIIGHDIENSQPLRSRACTAHLARLDALRNQGRLLIAGPFPAIDSADPGPAGFTGSLMIAEFDSLAAAHRWAEADPYLAASAWRRIEVMPFKKTFP